MKMSVNVDKTFCGISWNLKPTVALQQTFLSGREHSLQNIVARSGFSYKFLWFLNDIFRNFKDVHMRCMNTFPDYANIVFLYDA